MTQHLYYNIAGHALKIETPDVDKTIALLPTFKAFRSEAQVDNNLLFTLRGGKAIAVPEGEADETVTEVGGIFTVYNRPEGITIAMGGGGMVRYLYASPDRSVVTTDLSLTDSNDGYFLSFFLRIAYGMASVHRQTLKIHASVIEKEGKALIFLGESGTGKSTHSKLWQEHVPGCTLLNDDEPIVRLMDDGSVCVFGAPWSGSTPCYRNASAEVAAFVHLYQSPENRLTRLRGVQAYASLFKSAGIMRSDRENRALASDFITEMLGKVPAYRLDNRPDRDAVALSESLLKQV